MAIEITPTLIEEVLPRCKDPEMWSEILNNELPYFEIDTERRVASFLAQTGHESAHFNVLLENLNYSADALQRVFGKYFPTRALAEEYARQPAKIANRVYANRMENGPEESGDGWRYRGRGLIQLTGHYNYRKCSFDLFQDERFLEAPEMLAEPRGAILSACWFWDSNNLNNYADDVKKTTRMINGGYHGLEERIKLYNRALNYLLI